MAFIIFALFAIIWYLPPYKKQGKLNKLPGKTYIKAFLFGLIPATVVLLFFQQLVTLLMKQITDNRLVLDLVDAFICAAVIEELTKFLFGWLVCRKANPQRKIDFALLFGAVGLGYQTAETLMILDSVITAVMRGLFAYHLMWQFCMGLLFFEYLKAKENGNLPRARKYGIATFTLPIILHGINDFLCFRLQDSVTAGATDATGWWMLAFIVFFIISVVYVVIVMRRVFKAARESREAETAVIIGEQ